MNLLAQFQQIFSSEERGFATITDIRSDGKLIATIPNGSIVLLNGVVAIGKNVYYNRVTSDVITEAPNVAINEYGV